MSAVSDLLGLSEHFENGESLLHHYVNQFAFIHSPNLVSALKRLYLGVAIWINV